MKYLAQSQALISGTVKISSLPQATVGICCTQFGHEEPLCEAYQGLNDIRLLASGPRCGLAEINLPNCNRVLPLCLVRLTPLSRKYKPVLLPGSGAGHHSDAGGIAGQLELNVMEPVITFALFTSSR